MLRLIHVRLPTLEAIHLIHSRLHLVLRKIFSNIIVISWTFFLFIFYPHFLFFQKGVCTYCVPSVYWLVIIIIMCHANSWRIGCRGWWGGGWGGSRCVANKNQFPIGHNQYGGYLLYLHSGIIL
jgi:hypothetical protein